ncbi:MAG: 30S ribosomal protein S12 methylthiotransferase RimO [Frankiaceae bacterium]|nr:30S ribosomal protein S12 methylthiotransferase RimO [Frankiaceae bacterium]
MPRSVALVTLGCARNEVDSEELAARLERDGWVVTDDAHRADAVMVNTCGFIEAAKADSIEQLLEAADTGRPVIAVGCMAERYGGELARELDEVTVLGFDDYAAIGDRLDDVIAGRPLVPHTPQDRRTLLPISPVDRATAAAPPLLRKRLDSGPVASIRLASGCDRRCAFCAIPTFRGAFVSRQPAEVLAEAEWLADTGVREIVLVSENSTSYGKDLGDLRLLEKLLPQLAAVDGIDRVRVSYLQPAEMRPSLVEVMTSTRGVAAYFDLSFQHSSESLLRRMRRFGGTEAFLELIASVRGRIPTAGVRSNVIVGFPGETDADVDELANFLNQARLDAIGVFGYSDEDGTEAESLPDKVSGPEIVRRVERISSLAEELTSQRAEDRIGEEIEVLIETVGRDTVEGRAEHQAPEVDGSVTIRGELAVGDLILARVVANEGVDLLAEPL